MAGCGNGPSAFSVRTESRPGIFARDDPLGVVGEARDEQRFVPRRLIAALARQLSLATVTPPLDPGIDEQFMFYPTRVQTDPASIWLRRLMLETGRELERHKR